MRTTESSENGSCSAALWSLCSKATNRCKRSTRFQFPTPARSGTGSCSIRTFRLRADSRCSVSGFDPRSEPHRHTNFAEAVTNPEVRARLVESRDKFAMPPEAIARAVAFMIEQPADVDVGEI